MQEQCVIARDDGTLAHGTLLNLSNEGFCVETTTPLRRLERIQIRVLGLGRFHGFVCWANNNRSGGRLDPISPTLRAIGS